MGTQLTMLEAPVSAWRLDDKTREVGRRGLAEARAALRSAGGRAEQPQHSAEAA
ncbi:MAG TPA: hypothetical protein VK975_03285 [Acidimicrobiales bacterium]|nr:hypothetical protein [Acidimicrobiales bacterium]